MKKADTDSAYHEGRLAAVREARAGGHACLYRSGPKKAAWSRGLNDGRNERVDAEHRERIAQVPEAEREANKTAFKSTIEAWLEQSR